MAEMDRNRQMETLLQEIERLRFDNEELVKQHNMDRLRIQSDWQRHMEGFSLQPTPRIEKTVHFPVQVKKELDHESSPCRTSSANINPSENELINCLGGKNSTTRQTKDGQTMLVKAATYDRSSSWLDYKAHFETCAEINNWTNIEEGLYLAVALHGQAQSMMGNLSDKSKEYDSLTKALKTDSLLTRQNLFRSIKNSCGVLNELKSRGFCASSLSTYDFSTIYTTLLHNLVKD